MCSPLQFHGAWFKPALCIHIRGKYSFRCWWTCGDNLTYGTLLWGGEAGRELMLATLPPCWACIEVPEGKHLQCWGVCGILSGCEGDDLSPRKRLMFHWKIPGSCATPVYEPHVALAQAGSFTPVITSTQLHFQNFWHLPSISSKPLIWARQCLSDLWACTFVMLSEVDDGELLCLWTVHAWCMEKDL